MKEIKFIDPEENKNTSENPIKEIIIEFLKDGLSQKQIAFELQKKEVKPNSLSSIEKYLKALREEYGASTLFHLACLMIKSGELIIDDL
ncbi:helix-turn-helix transcriptional regulator [Chryseobacterium sp. NFX27]|uniref:helix-turn-helix transcriptional regulator n=1 Tax=Chryseobacterium sp. NFX27 TaxID=2819618 RepID=UPI003CE6961C